MRYKLRHNQIPVKMKNRGKYSRLCSPNPRDKEAFCVNLKTLFGQLFAPVTVPLLLPGPVSPSEERRQRQEFSKWVDQFKNKGGFDLLWDLQWRKRIPSDTAVYILVGFQREDMQRRWIKRGKEIKTKLQNRDSREWVSGKIQECADILTTLRLILPHVPHRYIFPLQVGTESVVKDLRRTARWVEELPPPQIGAPHKEDNWHRAIAVMAYFKGICGTPLKEYTAKLLHCAFPETWPSGGKDTLNKMMKIAGKFFPLDELPVTAVPEEIKVGKAAKRRG